MNKWKKDLEMKGGKKMEELKEIVTKLVDLNAEIGLKCSGDIILDCATRIFNTRKMNGATPSGEPLATPKQKNYLKFLGFKGNFDKLTKKEASKVIDEIAEK